MDNAVYLVEKRFVELPIGPDTVRRAFTNVQEGDNGYEHASRKLKDVFDAIAMALSAVRSGRGSQSMDVLAVGGRRPGGNRGIGL